MNTEYQFMVDFTLPEVMTDEFISLIPNQRASINELFEEGVLINYALSLEKSKLWAIVTANSEMEVMEYIATLPLSRFMVVEINMLTFFNTKPKHIPEFSMN